METLVVAADLRPQFPFHRPRTMNRDVPARAHNATVQQRWDAPSAGAMGDNTQPPVVASSDSRSGLIEDRIQPQNYHRGRHADFETTADGDVLIVEPSLDDDCHSSSAHSPQKPGNFQGSARDKLGDSSFRTNDGSTGPSIQKRHTRNLSAHFLDATTLSCKESPDSADSFQGSSPDTRKHRRMTSGGVSNPNTAHRRLNSRGNSAPVPRSHHHREHSAGLDMLSAAANASREELEQAAGRKIADWQTHKQQPHQQQQPPPPEPLQAPSIHEGGYRSFPPPTSHAMPPPTHQMRRYSGPGPNPPPYYPPPPPYATPYHEYPCYYPPYQRADYSTEQYPPQHAMYPPSKPQYGPPQTRSVAVATDPNANSTWEPQRATQGSQTFLSTMGAGANRAVRPAPASDVPTHVTQHHRRLSSFSSLGTFLGGSSKSPERAQHPLKKKENDQRTAHHRSTSSSVSFLNALDVAGMTGNMDDSFMRTLHEPANPTDSAQVSTSTPSVCLPCPPEIVTSTSAEETPKKLAQGLATSKRVRRKCTINGCPNRVVQGGLCISHGAKRKTCKHPGCNKNVKKAGLCSTHGPARKRCEVADCQKVAVQGGRCIAHGAKKKLCIVEACTKQAILGGMCKKHHDQSLEAKDTTSKAKTHQRGLSIFNEISADTVQTLINADAITETSPENNPRWSC